MNKKLLKLLAHYEWQIDLPEDEVPNDTGKEVINQFIDLTRKGYGISFKSGLLYEMDDIQFGLSFETETNIIQKRGSFSSNEYLPENLNLGFLILLTKKVESK